MAAVPMMEMETRPMVAMGRVAPWAQGKMAALMREEVARLAMAATDRAAQTLMLMAATKGRAERPCKAVVVACQLKAAAGA